MLIMVVNFVWAFEIYKFSIWSPPIMSFFITIIHDHSIEKASATHMLKTGWQHRRNVKLLTWLCSI